MKQLLAFKALLRQPRLRVISLYAVQDGDNMYHDSVRHIRRMRLNASREGSANSLLR